MNDLINKLVDLKELKDGHQKQMDMYSAEVRAYVDLHGNDGCDYLEHRARMSNYHRGGYNATLAAIKIIES